MMSGLVPDDGAPNKFRRKVVATRPISGTRTGKYARLECGHIVAVFGDLTNAPNGVICDLCQPADDAEPQA